MSPAHARDPHAELDALVREAMGLTSALETAPSEPVQKPLGGKVVNFTERMSKAVLQGFSRSRR